MILLTPSVITRGVTMDDTNSKDGTLGTIMTEIKTFRVDLQCKCGGLYSATPTEEEEASLSEERAKNIFVYMVGPTYNISLTHTCQSCGNILHSNTEYPHTVRRDAI